MYLATVIHSAPLAFNPLSSTDWITAFGKFAPLGIMAILFVETGLLVGFFLPGDSLLFTAGLLCTTTRNGIHLNLGYVLVCAAIGAIAGAQVGYYLGVKGGRPMMARNTREKVRLGFERSEYYFAKYGHGKAIVLARFVPFVRTMLNPLAGILEVPVREFTLWNVVGGLLWTTGITLAGYGLGNSVSNIDHYVLPIIAVIVVLSVVPVAWELRKARAAHQAAAAERAPADQA